MNTPETEVMHYRFLKLNQYLNKYSCRWLEKFEHFIEVHRGGRRNTVMLAVISSDSLTEALIAFVFSADKMRSLSSEIHRIKQGGEGRALAAAQDELAETKEIKDKVTHDLEKAKKVGTEEKTNIGRCVVDWHHLLDW